MSPPTEQTKQKHDATGDASKKIEAGDTRTKPWEQVLEDDKLETPESEADVIAVSNGNHVKGTVAA